MSQPWQWRELHELTMLLIRRTRAVLGLGPSTAGVAILVSDDDGRWLLVQASYRRTWSPPGGFVKVGEPLEEAARRELLEEVGIAEIVLEPVGVVGLARRHTTHIFAGHARPDNVTGTSWEIRSTGWFAPESLPTLSRTTAAILRMRPPRSGPDRFPLSAG